MIIRGIRSQPLTSLATFLLTLIVVSGSMVVVGFGRLAHVSEASAGVLVLLGLVAISAQAAESARRRQPELALARLRGRRGVRLLLFAVGAQLSVAFVGCLLGVGLGGVLTRLIIDAWLTGAPAYSIGSREWMVAGGLFAISAVTILVSCWSALRRPLVTALAEHARPGARPVGLVFLEILVVIAAVVSLYEAHQPVAVHHEWVPLLSPVIVGLAAGQIVVWLLGLVLAAVTGRSARAQRLGWFLTVRRLRRRAASTTVLRTLVGAGVVMAVAFCALSASAGWRDDRARLQAGAPLRFPMHANALRAYVAAEQADPSGRWLMPVAAFIDPSRSQRRVMVDASRWRAVVGDFFASTSAADVSSRLAALGPAATPPLLHGTTVSVTVPAADRSNMLSFGIALSYVDDDGSLDQAKVAMGRNAPSTSSGASLTFEGHVRRCSESCALATIDMIGRTRAPVVLDSVVVGGRNLLRAGGHLRDDVGATAQPSGTGLSVNAPHFYHTATQFSNIRPLVDFAPQNQLRVVATRGFHLDTSTGAADVQGVDGNPRNVSVVGTVSALPFVGTSGTLMDLRTMLAGAGGSIPETQAYVLARADTPASVLAALRAMPGIGPELTFSQQLSSIDETPRAQGSRMFLLVAVSAGLVAIVFLITIIVAQTRERRTEAASLRSLGLAPATISSAYRREALTLGLTTFVGTSAAAWVACRGLLARLPLVSGWSFAPPLDSAPRLGWILLVSVGLGVVVGGAVLVGFARIGATSPPRLLREALR